VCVCVCVCVCVHAGMCINGDLVSKCLTVLVLLSSVEGSYRFWVP